MARLLELFAPESNPVIFGTAVDVAVRYKNESETGPGCRTRVEPSLIGRVDERISYPQRILSAASILRVPTNGNNWIRVGDAAMSFDPLSGQGITRATDGASRATLEQFDILAKTSRPLTREFARTPSLTCQVKSSRPESSSDAYGAGLPRRRTMLPPALLLSPHGLTVK